MKQLTLFTFLLVSCAPLIRQPDVKAIQVDVMKQMNAMQSARAAALVRCTPLKGRQVPWTEERYVGSLMATRLFLKRPLVAQPELSQRVALVGRVVARRSVRADLPWVFGVVKNDVPETFALPGGYIFVSTGLLTRMNNEAELAGVLSREIAHVAARDPVRLYSDAVARQCEAATLVAAMAEAGLSPGPAQQDLVRFGQTFAKPFDIESAPNDFQFFLLESSMGFGAAADDEVVADRTGAELTAFAGYDVAAFEEFLTRLDAEPKDMDSEGRRVHKGYLSFKPATAERVAKLKALREGDLSHFIHGAARPDLTPLLAPLKSPQP